MTDQLTTPPDTELTERFEPAPLTARPVEAPPWTQHRADEFPHRTGEHAPNLATLAQLRSGGRNPLLLSAKRRRQVGLKRCTPR